MPRLPLPAPLWFVVLIVAIPPARLVTAEEIAPTRFDVLINGENFTIEGERAVKLASKKHPGTTYEVAVRIAPTQRAVARSFEFDYPLPAKVTTRPGEGEQLVVELRHELGFTLLMTDLVQPLDAAAQQQKIKQLSETVLETFRELGLQKIEPGDIASRDFAAVKALGRTIHYQDKRDAAHTCLVYLLTGDGPSATLIAQYRDQDAEDVLPLIRRILDSMRGKK